ncbi:MAG: DUF2157 domain-containing protein [Holophaga sp.]|nr:DUF2157 domain-containing protein [Holophaga sp.]
MTFPLNERLSAWLQAGLLDPAQAERIRAFEQERESAGPGSRRLVSVLTMAFGVLMVGAGILLFVAANWSHLGPAVRFLLVLALVGGFHLGGVLAAPREPRLAIALHGLGTLALGAGIYLAGQIFNLQEHWPGGLLLWALGAWMGWALLRDWVQGTLVALLTPAWIAAEWSEAMPHAGPIGRGANGVLEVGCLLLAITYLTLGLPGRDGLLRRALAWVGGIYLLPGTVALAVQGVYWAEVGRAGFPGDPRLMAGWAVALGAPLGLAFLMRGRAAWRNLAAALWVLGIDGLTSSGVPGWAIYLWCALGALGMVVWGLDEGRSERVNLGVAGFAVTLLAFYCFSVMDQLGRSLGLLVLGLLFLAGGWQLERLRRRLTARIRRTP